MRSMWFVFGIVILALMIGAPGCKKSEEKPATTMEQKIEQEAAPMMGEAKEAMGEAKEEVQEAAAPIVEQAQQAGEEAAAKGVELTDKMKEKAVEPETE